MKNWYVVTGGPSTGKTTLLHEIEKREHKIIPELSRAFIDQQLSKGFTLDQIRADEEAFQHEILRLKVRMEEELDENMITFFDRGVHDTMAYLNHYGYKIEQWIQDLLQKTKYKKVFLLEPLPTYVADYARIEDHDFTLRMHNLLHAAYSEFGMEPITVPVLAPSERAQFVLQAIDEDGL